jgi:hypothetical protein
MIIGFESELGSWCNVVLRTLLDPPSRGAVLGVETYIDTPEFLDRVESDDFLQKIVPVVTLDNQISVDSQQA